MANPFQVASGTVTGTVTSRSVTVANATSAGDTLLVVVVVNNATTTVSACTDSKGNVYTLDKSFTTTLPTLYAFRSPGATGGSGGAPTAALSPSGTPDTVTITTAAVSGNVGIDVVCAPGVGPVDQIATIATGTSTTPSVSATPAANNEIAVSYFGTANAGGAPAVNNSYTSAGGVQTGTNPYGTVAYKALAGQSGVSQTSTLTITSAAWRAGMWTFKTLGTPYTVVSGNGTGTTLQVTVSSAAAVNDTLVIGAGLDGGGTVTSVIDSQGNTYVPVAADYNQSDGIAVFTCLVGTALVSGTDWIKATYSSATGSKTLNGRGCSGVALSSAVDVAIVNDAASGTAMSSGSSGTLAAGNEWAVAFSVSGNGGSTPSAWSGGFTAQDTQHPASNQYQVVADQIVSATTALTAGATILTTQWAMVLVTLRAAGSATAWKVQAAQTVTASTTAALGKRWTLAASQAVTATSSAAVTRGKLLAAAQTVTATSTAGIVKASAGTKLLDVNQVVTQSRTAGTRLAARLAVSQAVTASDAAGLTKFSPFTGLGTPYTLVSGGGGVGLSDTLQVTVEATSAAGDAIVIGAGSDGTGNTVTGVTDSKGNSYTLVKSNFNQSDKLAVFAALNAAPLVSGVDWVKAQFGGTSGAKTLNGRACSGIVKVNAVDVAITNDNAASTSMSSGTSAALAQGAEWAVAFSINGNGGGASTSWSGGFTAQDTAHVSSNQYQTVADQITTSTAALTAGATVLSTKWAMILVTLKAAAGTQYHIDVSQTVTVSETVNIRNAAKMAVAQTITQTRTAGTRLAARLAVSQSVTAARAADVVKLASNQKIIDLRQVLTVTVSPQARKLFKLQVNQLVASPVVTGSKGGKLADVSQPVGVTVTANVVRSGTIGVNQLVTVAETSNVAPADPRVVAQWTESAVIDYGLRVIGVDNNPGDALVAFVGWSADTVGTNPVAYVADDAHNTWTQLETSPASGLSRGTIWICTNAQVGNLQTGITTVSVSTSLPTAGIAFTIAEIANLPPYVVLSGLENSDRINNGNTVGTSGVASGPAWGFALCVSDNQPAITPGSPWKALATASSQSPGRQPNHYSIAVAETVAVGVTANPVKGNANAHQIDVSQVVTARATVGVSVGTQPPPTSASVLYVGANMGPQGAPTATNFTNALTGANGAPNFGPLGAYKVFYSNGTLAGQASPLYTGILGSTWPGSLEDQITRAQPGTFVYVSWAAVMSQAAINSYVGSIPSTDRHGNKMVVGFTFQSEPENAYPTSNAGGDQFVSDWIDQAKKIRSAQSLTGAKLVLITSHYMPEYGSDSATGTGALGGHFIPPVTSGGVVVTDVYGADFYERELASGSYWSTGGLATNQRWLNLVPLVKAKAGANPQFALTEWGISYTLANVGTDANGQSIRNTRLKADIAYIGSSFGNGGAVSSQPLWSFLFWETGDKNFFSDAATAATVNSFVHSAGRIPGVTA